MDNILKLIFVFLLLFSGLVFADTYPALPVYYAGYGSQRIEGSTQSAVCESSAKAFYGSDVVGSMWGGSCVVRNQSGAFIVSYSIQLSGQKSCPGGGTVSGSSCINAPACVAPAVRGSDGICVVPPVVCDYPEVPNEFDICGLPECAAGEQYNYKFKGCQDKPYCADAEKIVETATNLQCELKPLSCPGHSHASSHNDQCLPDPALTCPTGQHDDGSYQCIADDAPAPCKSNEYTGSIEGQGHQCIPKSSAAAAAARAASVAAIEASASYQERQAAIAAEEAQANYNSAQAASDADPMDSQLANAAASAYSSMQSAQSAAATAATATTTAKANTAAANSASTEAATQASSQSLQGIESNTKSSADSNKSSADSNKSSAGSLKYLEDQQKDLVAPGFSAGTFGAAPDTTVTEWDANSGSVGSFGDSSSCPAPYVMSMSFGSQNMSFQPLCDLVSSIRPIFILMCTLVAAFIIFGGKRD